MSKLLATSEAVAAKAGVPAIVVEAAIVAIAQLVVLCLTPDPTPEVVLAAAQRPYRRQRRRMENAVWHELGTRGLQSKYVDTMRALRGEIALMTAGDVRQICEDCTNGTADYGN